MTNKELKLKAKRLNTRKSGILTGATLIYGLIDIGIISIILYVYSMNLIAKGALNSPESMQIYINKFYDNPAYSLIIQGVSIIISALMATVLAGLQYICITIARGGEVKTSDVFFAIKNNPDKVILIVLIKALISFVFALPVNVMAFTVDNVSEGIPGLIYDAFLIVSYVADIALAILMSQCIFAYIDDPGAGVISYIEKSVTLIRGNVGRYVLLWLGFIPLSFVALFTFGIMYLWLLPYMWTTYALFYMELTGENQPVNVQDTYDSVEYEVPVEESTENESPVSRAENEIPENAASAGTIDETPVDNEDVTENNTDVTI